MSVLKGTPEKMGLGGGEGSRDKRGKEYILHLNLEIHMDAGVLKALGNPIVRKPA